MQMIEVGAISLIQMRAAILCAKPNVTAMLQLCKVYLRVCGGWEERAWMGAIHEKKLDILSESNKS